jgi:hypothetical protein
MQVSLNAHSPWKSLRDSHIPTVATKQWNVENRKQVSHFPLPCFPWFQQIQKGGLAAELRSSSRLIVRLENARGSVSGAGMDYLENEN